MIAALTTTPLAPLFVPGDRPERFAKAAASGADAVILDLEDAVAPEAKGAARSHIAAHGIVERPVILRINDPRSEVGAADLDLLRECGADLRLAAVMVPKAETPAMLAQVRAALPKVPLIALLETALGIERAHSLCAEPGVLCPAFGSLDLALDLGISPDHALMDQARGRLVIAARAAGVAPPLDGVTPVIDDPEPSRRAASAACAFGFGGKMAIHPRQIAAIRDGFAPDPALLDWAQRVLHAVKAGSAGAVKIDGQMIDAPVLARARAILARAGPVSA
ncbi:MAG: CoA ester lyase [Neomegalonema sp.]|nr:CoA ester lyase [Neomegalonema sp.]